MGSDNIKVVVTGASGLLGRAVVKEVVKRGHTVIGTAFSRAGFGLEKLDLKDATAVTQFMKHYRPQAVIHCAAETRPDFAERDKAAAELLNVKVPGHLAELSKDLGAFFVYISTDYVFDGTQPPYKIGDTPNPLNFYGYTKFAGEQAVSAANPHAAILRVPVLYGMSDNPKEGSINVLVNLIRGTQPAKVDDVQPRFPTCTDDVARVLLDMVNMGIGSKHNLVKGIFHFSAKEKMTKYEICQDFARILGIDMQNKILPIKEKPVEPVASRPDNCELSTEALEHIGISVNYVPFHEWWSFYLKQHK
ncbi:NAD dependent epimerase/dehydratase [Coemansia reversa NRRL 1564]|uniref:NAD dependent epimerase/dehydratase n=1 Tax=Coemansia reversa (strain ATCC 12441 / NRRL 1564) TaxID=763665 RepID=A0A2G5BGW5_COERN|nr:NAD dependent epimerase/dehydratase [Coemansia reversa NRRL 1564]|eukprot:PIA18259.1 NAD dependent epimerase/dehydratase [Coemansia reversa NRRL 1564]